MQYESTYFKIHFDKAEFYYSEVLKYTGSNPDCACDSNEVPTLILSSGGGGGSSNTYVVDVCNTNNALSVSSNTIGNETTYTICFNDEVWTKINSLSETIITSNDGSVTVVPSVDGDEITWDLSVQFPPVSDIDIHSFSGIIDIDMSNAYTDPPSTISWRSGWSTTVGNKLQEPSIVNVNNTPSLWQSNDNEFYLDNYIDQSGGEFPKPQLQLVAPYNGHPISIIVSNIDTVNNRIYFRFINDQGIVYSSTALSETRDLLSISVIINA